MATSFWPPRRRFATQKPSCVGIFTSRMTQSVRSSISRIASTAFLQARTSRQHGALTRRASIPTCLQALGQEFQDDIRSSRAAEAFEAARKAGCTHCQFGTRVATLRTGPPRLAGVVNFSANAWSIAVQTGTEIAIVALFASHPRVEHELDDSASPGDVTADSIIDRAMALLEAVDRYRLLLHDPLALDGPPGGAIL